MCVSVTGHPCALSASEYGSPQCPGPQCERKSACTRAGWIGVPWVTSDGSGWTRGHPGIVTRVHECVCMSVGGCTLLCAHMHA